MRQLGYKNFIFGLTGNTLADDVEKFLSVGANMVLFKPLKIDELKVILQYIENIYNQKHNYTKEIIHYKLILNGNQIEHIQE